MSAAQDPRLEDRRPAPAAAAAVAEDPAPTTLASSTGPAAATSSASARGQGPARGQGFGATLKAYVSLTKPRVIELLIITTIPTMFLAAGGFPDLLLIVATVVGGYLAAPP